MSKDHRNQIAIAKKRCIKDYPWLFEAFFKLDPRPKQGCNTIAIDPHLRLYYDPELVQTMDMADIVYQIKKATLAPILLHGKRGVTVTGTKSGMEAWCTASDVVINDLLALDGQAIPDDARQSANTVCSQGYPLPGDLSIEQYFRLLYESAEEEEDDPNGPDEGQGEGQGEPDGSGKHGQPQPYEDPYAPPKLGEDADGITDEELDNLREALVDRRGSDSMSRSGCHALASMVAETAEHKISPQELLRMAICTDLAKAKKGFDCPTYKRPARRPSLSKFVRPSYLSPTPKVCVIVDVSSSMGEKDIKLAFGMIDTVFNGMRVDEIRVIGANTNINTDQSVRKLKEVELKLGGGTSMDVAVDRVMSEPTNKLPDLCILVTDGGTDWPSQTSVPFIACCTRPERDKPLWTKVPNWMKLVYMVD